MERIQKQTDCVTLMIKSLLVAYGMTIMALLVLALCLYQFRLGEKIVSIAVIIIYILITFFSGFIIGRKRGEKKFLWGLLSGTLYFLVLVIISLLVNGGMEEVGNQLLTTLVICAASGMLGGMMA